MEQDIKIEALLEMAKSFRARGNFIQYDQRSMDRVVKISPRRSEYLPPEAATSQKTVFLDCSSYVNALFYQTFGEHLASDLTWHMIDYVKPRIYFYELTHEETEEDCRRIEEEVRAILKPGDVITYENMTGTGHTVLYMGDNKFTDCSPNGRPDSYNYEKRMSQEYESGGLWVIDASLLFVRSDDKYESRKSIIKNATKRFSIARPTDVMESLTDAARAKLGPAKDLVCSVESSYFGGMHAQIGEDVTYTVSVKNTSDETKNLTISFTEPFGSIFNGNAEIKSVVEGGKTAVFEFTVKVGETEADMLMPPKVIVNTLDIYSPLVLVGNKLESDELEKIVTETKKKILNGTGALEAAAAVYSEYGIKVTSDEVKALNHRFAPIDSGIGDVLSRRVQKPGCDYTVYSLFGGYGVITTDRTIFDFIRCNKIRKCDLFPGDIIVCCDDPHYNKTYSCLYTGENLIGTFEYGENTIELNAEETDTFIDSLFGRFAFIVIRPQLQKKC